MRSPIYWHPTIYTLFMRALCFGYYNERYQEVADLIPSNSSVLDVCCGDCKLFDYIKFKKVTYVGVDFNKVFDLFESSRRDYNRQGLGRQFDKILIWVYD